MTDDIFYEWQFKTVVPLKSNCLNLFREIKRNSLIRNMLKLNMDSENVHVSLSWYELKIINAAVM